MVDRGSRNCWSCDAEHAAVARFCSACGARLTPGLRQQGRRRALAPKTYMERRQLTVMFCDLVGSTNLSLGLDPEDYTSIVRAYRDASVRVIRHWKGYTARYVGDGLLTYFGYPRASEDDAFRAVAAALELVQVVSSLQLSKLGLAGRVAPNLQLQVRVGIHTGVALVGEIVGRESTEIDAASGAAPNIAAKLQGLARPGDVIISEATAKLLPSAIQVLPVADDKAEANTTGVRAFTVSALPHQLVTRRSMSGDCFVGRSAQLSRVVAAIAASRQKGIKYLFVGEPGIGKSRFVREVIRHSVAASFSWIELACSPQGQSSPLHPFRPLLSEAQQAHAGSLGRLGINPGHSDLSPFQRRRRAFEQLKVAILAQGARLGLVIEDLHWADPTTLEFMGELMSAADAEQIVWLMTSRVAPQREIAQYNVLCVETLDRLLPGEAAELARATSGHRQLTSFQLAEIVDRADGVPLYIEEFVRAVANFEHTDKKTNEGRIPTTLRDSLMSRLDALRAGRGVALQASVLGRHFAYQHLCELLELGDQELVAALNTLTSSGILLQTGSIPNASFEFRHALLRDIAYQTLLRSDRDRLHRRVAQLAADGVLGEADAMPELLAIHHSLGGNPKEAVGHWLKAGLEAIKRSANAEALDHLKKGLEDCQELAKSDAPAAARAELELLSALPAPLIAVSGWSSSELERVYTRAKELCAEVGSEETEFQLDRGRYNLHLLKSEIRTADGIADRLLAMARETTGPEAQRARLLEGLRTKALSEFYQAHNAEARTLLDQMMELYDPSCHAGHTFLYGAEPAAVALSYLAWLDSLAGQQELARTRLERALEQANATAHAFSICYVHCFASSCAQLWGKPQLAAASADDAIRLSNRHNFQYWSAWGRALRGWVLGLEAPEQGIQAIDEARAIYLATGSTLIAPYFDALACHIGQLNGIQTTASRLESIRSQTNKTGARFWMAALEVRQPT